MPEAAIDENGDAIQLDDKVGIPKYARRMRPPSRDSTLPEQ